MGANGGLRLPGLGVEKRRRAKCRERWTAGPGRRAAGLADQAEGRRTTERLQDALAQIGVHRDADRGLWRVEIELDAALGSEVGARCRGSSCDCVRVSRATVESGFVTRGCK